MFFKAFIAIACTGFVVATSAQGRVRHAVLEDRFDVDPRRAGHEPDEDPSEAQPVRHPRSVTAQRMGPIRRREQGSDRCQKDKTAHRNG